VFISKEWDELFPDNDLHLLPSICSDHAPLLLRLDSDFTYHKRFHFWSFWPHLPSFLEVVERAWRWPLRDTNPCRHMDWLLRNTSRALKSLSDIFIGSVRIQLEVAKEVIHHLEIAWDRRSLAQHEEALRQQLKLKSLSLSSLQRIMTRQEAILLWLSEGDASMHFFHCHANAQRRKKHIHSLRDNGRQEDKTEAAFHFFNELLGKAPAHSISFNLKLLGLPSCNLAELCDRFTEEEVWSVIRSLPSDKSPGPDGYTAQFLQSTWHIIRCDVMQVFDVFWHSDWRNVHNINDTLITLIPKSEEASCLKDYQSISLIHLIGKLVSKVLANHLML
jgi:hypothetical protein